MSEDVSHTLLQEESTPANSRREPLYSKTFLLLCACYILIQYAVAIHSVTDLALYRFLFCSELHPGRGIKFEGGHILDPQCAADSISERVALLTGTLSLAENIPGTALVLFYGRLSDEYGRRPILLLLLLGGVLQNLLTVYTATHFASTGIAYFYTASFVAGVSGTNPALRTVTWSVIADLFTSSQNRLLAFSAIAAFNYLGMIIGPASGSALLTYDLLAPLIVSTILLSAAVLVLWYMPESMSLSRINVNQTDDNGPTDMNLERSYVTGYSSLAIYFRDFSYLFRSRNSLILALITFIWNLTGGVMLIVVQYLNQDFEWSIVSGGYFYAAFAGLKVFVLLTLLPLFVTFARGRRWVNLDYKLLILCLIGDGLAYCIYSLTTTTLVLPIIILLQALCAPLSVSLRVLISQLATIKNQAGQEYGPGKIFAAMSVLEGIGDLAGPAVWNSIYAALLGSQREYLVFIIVGCAYFSGAIAAMFYIP